MYASFTYFNQFFLKYKINKYVNNVVLYTYVSIHLIYNLTYSIIHNGFTNNNLLINSTIIIKHTLNFKFPHIHHIYKLLNNIMKLTELVP